MPDKVLIVDDEDEIVSFIKDALVSDGYEVLVASNGEEALAGAGQHPDLIILDIMMPGMSGLDVCQRIRDLVACPILFLSALDSDVNKVRALALGGDDYLTKPFSLRELKARIAAHLRREKRAASLISSPYMRYANLSINLKGHEVVCRGQVIPFTKREFDIVELLVLHPGLVFSKDQIYEKIWGYDAMGDSACVAEHVKKIRSKLHEHDQETEYIATVWGVGYKWEKGK